MTHYVRIEHKKKRSHHKAKPLVMNAEYKPPRPLEVWVGPVRPNLWAPVIVRAEAVNPWMEDVRKVFPRSLHRYASQMAGKNPDAARLGLWFLREYRMEHKYWECV